MKTLSLFPFALLLFLSIGALSSGGVEKGEADANVTELARVEHFAFGGVGFAGTTSLGETLYLAILGGDGAEEAFLKVYETGNNQAKSYALCGLFTLKSERYAELRADFLEGGEKKELLQMSGCIGRRVTPEAVVAYFEKRGEPK